MKSPDDIHTIEKNFIDCTIRTSEKHIETEMLYHILARAIAHFLASSLKFIVLGMLCILGMLCLLHLQSTAKSITGTLSHKTVKII